MFGHDAQGARDGRRGRRLDACELCARAHERRKQIALEDVRHALSDSGDPFEAHAGIDTRLGQGLQRTALIHLVLDENEVPVLDKTIAVAAGSTLRTPTAHPDAKVEVEFRTGTAGPRWSRGSPEIVLAAEMYDALVGEAVRLPQRDRLLVRGDLGIAAEDTDPNLAALDAERVGELQRPGDRLALEVVPEREIAQHLEEGEMARGVAHVLDVGRAEAALAGGDARRRRRLDAQIVRLVLLHAGGGEQNAGVTCRHQTGRLAGQMPLGDEEVSEQVTDVCCVHVGASRGSEWIG